MMITIYRRKEAQAQIFHVCLSAHPPHPHFHPHLGMEPPRPRFLFKMPRVVPNQKEKYESDDLMKRHSREGEVWLFVFCIVACK